MLPVVKAYPLVDHVSFSEAVCVAGISVEEPHRADRRCRGHEQSFIDWELGAHYRRLRDQEGRDENACLAGVRERFLGLCDASRDVRLITGSMLSHPTSFLILGLVYPKRGSTRQDQALFPRAI